MTPPLVVDEEALAERVETAASELRERWSSAEAAHAEARALVSGIREGLPSEPDVEVLICPPAQLLFPIAKAVAGSPIRFGAQNVHEAQQGAFTGEISAEMLKDTGCSHVIVGHSERRHVFGEPGDRLAKKVRAVVEQGMTAIYCVGEKLEERDRRS